MKRNYSVVYTVTLRLQGTLEIEALDAYEARQQAIKLLTKDTSLVALFEQSSILTMNALEDIEIEDVEPY